ncbi:MAG: YqaJ viral recombinase family protein [Thiotrichales bacterium]|nr:YqaJ viral recombinase family protein [Thiotrichales bacterium]
MAMEVVNLIQGTPEWKQFRLEHYPASEAPSMMGEGKYDPKTPEDLALVRMGLKTYPVSDYQQKIFDEGHEREECARPLVEQLIGDKLANMIARLPISGLSMPLSASFDGINFDGDILFEHKLWNEALGENVRNKQLSPAYYWQLEQQLLVSGAKKVIFVTSDSFRVAPEDYEDVKTRAKMISEPLVDVNGETYYTAANYFEWMEYEAVPGRAEELIAGWQNFEQVVAEVLVEDEGWLYNATEFLTLSQKIAELKDSLKELEDKAKPYRDALIQSAKSAGNSKMIGGGVEVSCSSRKGALDEKKLLNFLTQEQLEQCRKASSESWKVVESKLTVTQEKMEEAKKVKEKMGKKAPKITPAVIPPQNVITAGMFAF